MKIFSCCKEADGITKRICDNLRIKMGNVDRLKFKNDNNFVQYSENIRNEDVYLVQTANAPINERIMELLIMIDAAKRSSAGRITVVLPYFPYSRSDKKDQPRIPVTASLIARMIEAAGASRVLTCDLHNQSIQSYFSIPCDTITCQNILESYFLMKNVDNYVVVATDAGSSKKAYKYAEFFNAPIALINKQRISNTDSVVATSVIGEIKNKNALIFDDEVDTAGSLIAAANILKENGAEAIMAGCTHGVFSSNALEKIQESEIMELVVTDTIPRDTSQYSKITVLQTDNLFAKAIQEINSKNLSDILFER